MANNDQRQSRETDHQFDESIFSPQTDTRVELPGDEGSVFEEVQPFDQLWIWVMLGIELVIVILSLFLTGQPFWTVAMGLGVMTLTLAMLSSLKLSTRVDSSGVHFRMAPFHFKEQTIPWEEIDQLYVRKYSPILEYGGWGIRFGRSGKAFNVRGNYGIQMVKKSGKRVLIGTQRPDDAARYLSTHPLLV